MMEPILKGKLLENNVDDSIWCTTCQRNHYKQSRCAPPHSVPRNGARAQTHAHHRRQSRRRVQQLEAASDRQHLKRALPSRSRPLLYVLKKSGERRQCGTMQALNLPQEVECAPLHDVSRCRSSDLCARGAGNVQWHVVQRVACPASSLTASVPHCLGAMEC